MKGFIVVVDTPYFATTAKTGRGSLPNVEPGQYSVKVWYEGMRSAPKPQSVAVAAEDVTVSFVIAGN